MNDSRSFNDKLLPAATEVLWKTKGGEVLIIEQLTEVDNEIKKMVEKVKKDEIDVDDVPEEFLDPILGTLMSNPVKLPSGYILDKSTIARHLLSDQTDPFTRAPLNMEQLKVQDELKAKIEEFVNNYHAKKKEDENAKTNEESNQNKEIDKNEEETKKNNEDSSEAENSKDQTNDVIMEDKVKDAI